MHIDLYSAIYRMKNHTRKIKSKKARTQRKKGGGWWPWSTTTQSQTPLIRQNGSRNLLENTKRKAEQNNKNRRNAFIYQSGQDPNEKIGPY